MEESLDSDNPILKFESTTLEGATGGALLVLSICSSLCFQIRKKAPARKKKPII
jgi:hypothetical protein